MGVLQGEQYRCVWPFLEEAGEDSGWKLCLCRALDRVAWMGERVLRLWARVLCALNTLLAEVFALRQPWALLRFLFFLGYFYWALIRPYRLYPKPMPDVLPFPYMLLPDVSFFAGLGLMLKGMWLWFAFLFRWEVVRYWAVWGGSFVLAWLAAAFYLWYIFDLEVEPARRALRQRQSRWVVLYRAFAPRYVWRFRALDGRVEDDASAVYWFGGPGRLQVAMDNAVVLERTGRGEPRVLTPGPNRWLPVEGYERVRRILDLRDQHLRFDVALRTRDGVPLVFRDVRLVYSIRRGREDATLAQPYPHVVESIERLIRIEGGRARDLESHLPWGNVAELRRWRSVEHTAQTMRVAFRSGLRRAVSARTLQEVLAFIQQDEAAVLVNRWDVQPLSARPGRPSPGPLFPYGPFPQAPADLLPRFQLTGLLRRQNYEERGVSLHWADMNNWEVTVGKIKPQFLQAWQLSRENRQRAAPAALNQVRQDAYLAFLGAEIQRWDQILAGMDLGTPEGREAFRLGVRQWLSRLWALLQEIQDRQIDLNEVMSLHRP